MEEFSLVVDGLRITGAVYYPHNSKHPCPAICLCHGIPAAPPNPKDNGYAILAQRFLEFGFAACIFNFRGCGQSEGNLDLMGWTHDLNAVISYLAGREEDIDNSRMYLMGFSGGAATSAYVAAEDRRIAAVVLCACPAEFSIFTTEDGLEKFMDQCRNVGTFRDPGFPPSVEEWVNNFQRVNPIERIDRIAPTPLLIIHGQKDELINPSHAHKLFAKASEPKTLAMVPDGEHRLRTNETAIFSAISWLTRIDQASGKKRGL